MGPSGRHRKLHKVYYIFVPEININTINIWHFDRLFTTRIQSSTTVHFFFAKGYYYGFFCLRSSPDFGHANSR